MIKNIIFDMGNVLVSYDPYRVCRRFASNEEEAEAVNAAVFASEEWILLDAGMISEEDALKLMQARLLQTHQKETARLCMKHWHKYCMQPMPGAEELVKWVKEQGCGIYLCSNASLRLLDCYQDVIPGIRFFDGVLFSAEERCIKPDREIYQRLFKKFGLKPEECFFIDDQNANIEGARSCGMRGYWFKDRGLEAVKKELDTILSTTKI